VGKIGERALVRTRLRIRDADRGQRDARTSGCTLGGTVGKIGQHVAGEAQLTLNQTSLVFVARTQATSSPAWRRGHFPVDESDSARRLRSSPDTGTLLRSKKASGSSAREDLVGETLARASDKIRAAKAAQK
jgi:hypothetical protein